MICLSTLLYVLLALLAFALIVIVHEFGHLIVAKLFKVGVVEYSLGMGPVLWAKRWKETCYSIRAVPLGGFCAMYGETSLEAKDKGSTVRKNKKCDFKTDWAEDRSLQSKPWYVRLCVFLAGPFSNFLFAFIICLAIHLTMGVPEHVYISEVTPGGSAYEQGIQENDVVVGVNDRDVYLMSDYSNYKDTHPLATNDGYVLRVLRDGELMSFNVVPDSETGLIGIYIKSDLIEHPSLSDILYASWRTGKGYLVSTIDSLSMLFRGEAKLDDMNSIVGVTASVTTSLKEVEAEAVEHSGEENYFSPWVAVLVAVIRIMAFLSVNIGFINLLPIPALDGGHSLFCIVEGIIRRRIPEKVEYGITAVSLIFLLGLISFTFLRDIVRVWIG